MRTVLLVCIFSLFHYGPALAYKAAVYEYHPFTSDTPLNTILKNIEEYRQYADRAKSQSANIAVFPEYGLTTIVLDPEEYAIEINDTNDVITRLRDIAFERQIYLVVNLLEKVQEANKATKYYNTNLVFGRNGTILLKYRKINLYQEPKLTRGDDDQTLTFTTDFGVTFGIFTCFDILFDNPSRRVLENSDVTDIVYPTAWISIMPFYTALSVQHGYSVANGVNLLAANYGQPKESHGGSGIYLADGKVAEIYISDTSSSKPLVQEVAKITTRVDKTICQKIQPFGLPGPADVSNVTNYKTVKNFIASDYKFKNVDLSQRSSVIDICDGDFCCTFEIVANVTTTDVYKVMAFDGIIKQESESFHVRICSLLACESDSVDSCGNRQESLSTRFTKITVRGNVKTEDKTFYTPVTLDTNLLPIKDATYCQDHNATSTSFIQLTTTKAQEDVLVFGLFGKTVSAAGSIHAFGFMFLVVATLIKSVIF